jgi:hypothetical protein
MSATPRYAERRLAEIKHSLAISNPERIAKGWKPTGRPPGSKNRHMFRPQVETLPVQERFTRQIAEMIDRGNATMARWKLGER